MKTIKKLTVTVKYTAGLGEFECSDEAFEELKDAFESGDEIDATGRGYDNASEWLADNIKEADAMEISYEIDELE